MQGFDLDGFLPYQLAVLSARVSGEFSTLYQHKFGISVAEWRVVAHLSQSERVSVREIHERVDMDKSKVSRAASRLQSNGYISKTPNPADGRLVALELTPKGRAMVAELAPLAREFETSVMRELGQDAPGFRAALSRLLSAKEPRET